MRDAFHLLLRYLLRPYIKRPVDLPGIDRYDLAASLLGEAQRERRLSGGGRTCYADYGLFTPHVSRCYHAFIIFVRLSFYAYEQKRTKE